jgi:glycosyltransferase involved in cell wall biosynthesis
VNNTDLRIPDVSIIIPMYNAEAYIAKALKSVLQETDVALEVIVVNDRSTDRSLQILSTIQDPRVRLVNGAKAGIATTMNLGLAAARGRVIMRCDADDLFPKGRIAAQLNWLEDHPNCGAVCGSYDIIAPNGSFVLKHDTGNTAEDITEELTCGLTRTHLCTFAIRTDVLRQLGGYRPYFETGEDIDLQLRLGEVCQIYYQAASRYSYRLHNESITHVIPSEKRVFFDRVARTFQNERQFEGSDRLQRGIFPEVPQGSESRAYSSSEQIQGFLQGRAWQEYERGHPKAALNMALRSLGANPGHWPTWKNMGILVSKLVLQRRSPASVSALSSAPQDSEGNDTPDTTDETDGAEHSTPASIDSRH